MDFSVDQIELVVTESESSTGIVTAEKREQVIMLAKTGAARDIIATQAGIGVASVYRILASQRIAA